MKPVLFHILLVSALLFRFELNRCTGQEDETEDEDLSTTSSESSITGPGQNSSNLTEADPSASTDSKLAEFSKLKPDIRDCDHEATAKAINLLMGNHSDSKDLSIARTKFDKLRIYLAKKGFLTKPGSLTFQNTQDKTIHLKCSSSSNDKETRWRSEGLRKDKEFGEAGYKRNKLAYDAPAAYLYFRKFICKQEDCEHVFYVFTRPYPKVEQPQNYQEGDEIEMKCAINHCLYNNVKSDDCPTPLAGTPRFHPPVTMGWTFPTDKTKQVVTTAPPDMPDMTIETKNGLTGKDEFDQVVTNFPVSVTIKVKNASLKHAGAYECVVIDANGVVSTPGIGEDRDIYYSGRVVIHIREWWRVFVPLVVIAILIVIVLLLACCCPLSMEHDDGTVYSKDEMKTHVSSLKKGKAQSPERETSAPESQTVTTKPSANPSETPEGPVLEPNSGTIGASSGFARKSK